jgi:MFS family permease
MTDPQHPSPPTAAPPSQGRFPLVTHTLRALRHRNYRLFFFGQGISLIGTWMQSIALSWLVYRLTRDPLALGLVTFVSQLPMLLLAPMAGVLADRLNLHRVLVATQTLALLQALTLAALTLTGVVAVWHVFVLSLCIGLVNAMDMPARQAFVVQMITDRGDLPNAIALNSSLVNGARLLGPSIAGVIIAGWGEGICFLLNGISYVAVISALLLMRITPRPAQTKHDPVFAGLVAGLRYAFGFAPIRAVLLLLALVSLVGMPYSLLMPVIANQVLHGDSRTFGFMMAATGVGAMAGVLLLAARTSALGLGRTIARSALLFGAGLIAFALSRSLWLSLALLVLTGFGLMQQLTSCNTVLQTIVDEDKRGRVMSLYATAFLGMVPFGSLMAGALAKWIGAPETLLFGGAAVLVGGVVFATRLPALRELVRPIYVAKGILPPAPEADVQV